MAKERLFIGLYSGQAVDGVDAAIVSISGKGEHMKVQQLHHSHHAFTDDIQRRINDLSTDKAFPVASLAELSRDVALVFADAATSVMRYASAKPADIVAIGSSGQTVGRVPRPAKDKDGLGAMLELAAPAFLAARTKLPVASHFAQSDVAVGGLGGVIHSWADWVLFHDKRLSRVTIHLGGLASLVFIGGDSHPMDVVAFDVGPGTALLDAVTVELYGRPIDIDGVFASKGRSNPAMLHELLSNPFFQRPAPKTTERQQWGQVYVSRLMMIAQRHRCRDEDVLATLNEMVARGVSSAIGTLTERPHEIILTGGGARNIYLANRIRALCSPSSTINSEKYAISVKAKQAVVMAVLAAARVDEVNIYCPFATGAKLPTVLGSLVMPPGAPVKQLAAAG